MDFTYLIPTLFGLEGVAAAELRRLGLRDVKGEDGRVLCVGSERDLPRMNLGLRTAERVEVVIGRFHADNFDGLFHGANALPWEDFIPKDGAFPVKCQCVAAQLSAEKHCEKVLKGAVGQRLGGKYDLARLPETGPLYQIRCLILRDQVTLSLDSSGPSLHKRGYRALGVEAPLRETLAAGLVLLSRYRGKGTFADPFCGSGTIPIEAAMIAKNQAPGLNRSFSAQKWHFIPSNAWLDAAQEALDGEFHGSYDIIASDIDPAAVDLARHNAKLAGVDELIQFSVADAMDFAPKTDAGRIVTNPPYGQRLLEKSQAEDLYRDFGRVCRKLPTGWEVYVLSSHTEFERTFGRNADKKRKLYNGKLKCDLFQYQ